MRHHPMGIRNRLSALATLLYLGGGIFWLIWPLLDTTQAPTAKALDREAPALAAASASLLLLLAICRWLDDHRRPHRLGLLLGLVMANVLVRMTMSPGQFGVEPVFVVPFLAGLAFGAPGGVLVGAASCLVSTIVAGSASSALPGQCLAWAIVGAMGGLLCRVPLLPAITLGVPLAWASGPVAGLVLNAIAWPTRSAAEMDAFFPGLPPLLLFQRLVLYTYRTSFAVDGTRGAITALGVVVLAPLLLASLRRAWGCAESHVDESDRAVEVRVAPEAIARRERIDDRRGRQAWLGQEATPVQKPPVPEPSEPYRPAPY